MGYLRQADDGDEAEIYELIKELEDAELDRASFSAIYNHNRTNPNVHYWIYENDGEILGFISVHLQMLLHHTGIVAEIQEIIVKNKAKRQGIGSLLFQKAEEIGRQNKAIQLEVCCNQERHSSHAFYLAQGLTNHHYKFSKIL